MYYSLLCYYELFKAMNSLFKAKAIPVPVTTDFLDWTAAQAINTWYVYSAYAINTWYSVTTISIALIAHR